MSNLSEHDLAHNTDNYFQLLDLPVTFDLELQQLLSRYHALQRQFHPDRFVAASEQETALALHQSATINHAFHVLKDPLLRAEHLLSLQGVVCQDEQKTLQDNAFLMQQMQWRETLAMLSDSNTPTVHQQLEQFSAQMAARTLEYQQQLHDLLTTCSWQQAANKVCQLKFLIKLQQEIVIVKQRLLAC